MDKLKAILKKAGVVSRLQLAAKEQGQAPKSTGPHIVEIVDCKIVMGRDYQTQQERQEIRLLIKENGEQKSYNFPIKNRDGGVHYLVERLADFEPGDLIKLEYQRKGTTGFISVEGMDKGIGQGSDTDEEIPVINEEDYGEPPADFEGEY